MIETPVMKELFSRKTSTTDVWQCPKYTSRSSHLEMFCKKLFLKISQNPLDNTCVRASFLIKLQASEQDSGTGVFSSILQNFYEHSFIEHRHWLLLHMWNIKYCYLACGLPRNFPVSHLRQRNKNTFTYQIRLKLLIYG